MKAALAVLAVLVLMLIAPIAQAGEPAESPWRQGDEVFALDATWTKKNPESRSAFDVRGTWLHYAADNHRIGANVLFLDEGDQTGFAVGPSYERLFWDSGFFAGGDVDALVGDDLSDAASIAAAIRIGKEFYVGNSAAVRLQLRWQTTFDDENAEEAAELHQYGFNIGIMFGAPKGVPVN